MSWYLQVLRHYADFSGRARRKEYWIFTSISVIIESVLFAPGFLAWAAGERDPGTLAMVSFLVLVVYALATFLPTLAVGVRRLHDTDRSAWWLLIGFIPIIGGWIVLVFNLLDGTPGPNRFGPDPKGRGASQTPALNAGYPTVAQDY
jgi:uncharacterized membrane protein YhaH (DUF805 family)